MPSERYGNFAEGAHLNEILERVDALNERITQIEIDIELLRISLAEEVITYEEYAQLFEPLDQQLSIAKYHRDAYLSRLE